MVSEKESLYNFLHLPMRVSVCRRFPEGSNKNSKILQLHKPPYIANAMLKSTTYSSNE